MTNIFFFWLGCNEKNIFFFFLEKNPIVCTYFFFNSGFSWFFAGFPVFFLYFFSFDWLFSFCGGAGKPRSAGKKKGLVLKLCPTFCGYLCA
jgi:hypothetical protein